MGFLSWMVIGAVGTLFWKSAPPSFKRRITGGSRNLREEMKE